MLASELVARNWLAAFNRGDVPGLVGNYADHATHTSPKIRALHPDTGGRLEGKPAIEQWWTEAVARLPGLAYELTALTASEHRVVLEYVRHAPGDAPLPVAEVFDLDPATGLIVASRVYHG